MMRILRALAFAGAICLAFTPALGQQFPSGAVQGNGTASTAVPRATDINSVLYQKAGSDSCVFRRNSTSVACGSIDLSQSNAVGSSILGAANGGTGVAALGTGVATWLGTPSSANLRAALTDETGTGIAYFVGGALGTPASGTLTNATGLPISTGVAGLGTGVASALAINVGSAGAPVVLNGALGTPSSGTLTNATGLPIASGVSGLGTGVATALAINVGTAGAPVVLNGALGTPSSGTLTNATGLPIATGVSGLASNVATFLATPSSANLRAALTDETGTGIAYFVGGALGTPASGTLTNATGLPISTGVVGLGTGVASALAINVGSAGAPVVLNGALGTPSSGTLTNATGLPVSSGVSGLGTGVATALAINVGTVGAPVVLNGALGTPSSGTLTNATGLPIASGVSGLGTGVATALAINVGTAGAPVVLNGAGGTPSSLTLTNATGLVTNGLVDNAVTLGKMAQVATATFLGRTTASTGNVEALTTAQATALIDVMVGDSGSGGTKGFCPAPGAGDGAAGKFCSAKGLWEVPAGGGGGGSLSDTDRQNILLDRIYQAKSFGAYRRFVGAFADGYAGTDGVNAAASSNYTIDTTGKKISPTDATTTVTINSNNTTSPLGTYTTVDRTTAVLNSQIVTTIGLYSTNAQTFYLKIVKRNSANNYDVVVSQSFSHGGAGWQDFTLSSSYSVPGTGTYYLAAYTAGGTVAAQSSAARAYIASNLTGTGVATTAEDTGPAYPMRYSYKNGYDNATIVTTAQTADASVSNGRVLLEIDNTATPTLNTDLTVEVTCNGATNWASASLSSAGLGQAGRLVVETVDQACTGGTSFAARIKTLNNKLIPIYGVSVTAH